ncbi:MAG: hypothetical protein A2X40_08180 [Elusimicrobia bacterium GWC2_65_9]|nr:MAG: hypothetical protein A2X40_08180 [Elusimicrobia bacterium GWC2_65_9]OHC66074.1 MAG: hypothetical protein A2040_03795 [Rhodocyclales bacterium GWA2_65_19]
MNRKDADPLVELVETFNRHGVEYVIVGAHAVGWHGYPRATKDIDFLIRPTKENAVRVIAALGEFGFGFLGVAEADIMSSEKIIQLGNAPHRADLLSSIDGVDTEKVWQTRISGSFHGQTVHYIAKDLLIENKLAVGRPQDQSDVQKLEAQKKCQDRNNVK